MNCTCLMCIIWYFNVLYTCETVTTVKRMSISITPKAFSYTFVISSSHLSLSAPPFPGNHWYTFCHWNLFTFCKVLYYHIVCILLWLLSLRKKFRFIPTVTDINSSFLLLLSIFHYVDIPQLVYLFTGSWTFGVFPVWVCYR